MTTDHRPAVVQRIINPGINRALNAAGQLANIDTAIVIGARLRVRERCHRR
jgi:hypothetical protein